VGICHFACDQVLVGFAAVLLGHCLFMVSKAFPAKAAFGIETSSPRCFASFLLNKQPVPQIYVLIGGLPFVFWFSRVRHGSTPHAGS
jgi:hypothetical protein